MRTKEGLAGVKITELISRLEEILERDGDMEMELPDGTLITKVSIVRGPLPSVPRRMTADEATDYGERPETGERVPEAGSPKQRAIDRIRNARRV